LCCEFNKQTNKTNKIQPSGQEESVWLTALRENKVKKETDVFIFSMIGQV